MERARWQRVDGLLEQVLDRPEAERAAFLAAECAGDAELRREVESLLARDRADDFLATPAAGEAASLLATREAESLIGQRVGRFEILGRLGAGGMGEVYVGRDTRLDRKVALKRIPDHLIADPERLRRFRQEALATSALNHPNIVTVYEIVEDPGRDWMVTEWIDGETLRDHRGAEPLRASQALDIVRQIARGLGAAHAAGVVHRDVKPDNVMIRRDGLVKILDFGIAKSLVPAFGSSGEETTPGEVLGTSAYMSPEQARGEPLDARTDVWSLGVIFHELLTGRSPFPGRTPSDRLAAILERDPEPPSRLRKGVPRALDAVVARMLAKDPADRPRDGAALAAELDRLPSTPRRAPWGIVAMAALLLLTAAALLMRPWGRGAIDSLVVLPLVNVGGNAAEEYLSEGIADSLIRNLAQSPELKVISRMSVTRYGGVKVDPREVGRALAVRGVITGRMIELPEGDRISVGVELIDAADGSQVWSGHYERPRAALVEIHEEIARDVRRALGRELTPKQQAALTRQSRNAEAHRFYLQGRYYWYRQSSPGAYSKSGDFFQRAVEADPDYALAWSGLSHYYSFAAANGTMRPEEAWPRAADTARRAMELDPLLPDAYNTVAGVKLYRDRDWAGGEKDMDTGVALGGSPELINHYSFYLGGTGRIERAIRMRLQMFQLDPVSLASNRLYGRTLYHARRFDDAAAQFRKTIELEPNDSATHWMLGIVEAERGRDAEAIAEWSRALVLDGSEEQAKRLAETYATSGLVMAKAEFARGRLAALDAKVRLGEYVPAFSYVRQFLRMGDRERALVWAEKAFAEPNRLVLDLVAEPEFDPLRGDPRFQAGVRSLRLPAPEPGS